MSDTGVTGNVAAHRRVVLALALTCGAATGVVARVARAETYHPATWVAGVDGSWTDASKWSTNPTYPRWDTPQGFDYETVIGAPGTYTVTLPQDVRVHSVTIDAPGVTFLHQAGDLNTSTINLNVGTYLLQAGSIDFGSVNIASGATFDARSGNLVNVTLTGDSLAGEAGKTVTLNGGWRNFGTIHLRDGTLAMSGVFTTGSIGGIDRTGGAVVMSGSVTNSGTLLESGPWSGPLSVTGRIIGGTLRSSANYPITFSGSFAQLQNVTLEGDAFTASALRGYGLTMAPGARVTVKDGSFSIGMANFGSDQTLDGSGQIALVNGTLGRTNPDTNVTIGSDLTVTGSGTIDVQGLGSV